eukprot:1334202-Amorphochlora_amoeboformis.AAC.3
MDPLKLISVNKFGAIPWTRTLANGIVAVVAPCGAVSVPACWPLASSRSLDGPSPLPLDFTRRHQAECFPIPIMFRTSSIPTPSRLLCTGLRRGEGMRLSGRSSAISASAACHQIPTDAKVLEVGCGTGVMARLLCKYPGFNGHITGVC